MSLAGVIERAALRRAPREDRGSYLVASPYAPWWAQRMLHRSAARFRVVVAGRGVGKTHAAAFDTINAILSAPPGSEGAVIAPTYTHADAATAKLRELTEVVPGVKWKEDAKRLELPGRRVIHVYSADRKETVRGPSLVFMWIDEGAYVHPKAVEAALPAIRSTETETRLLITTTPAGKNWVFSWWEEGALPESGVERFRFKSTESPYASDPAVLERARRTMSADKFAQEFLAEFVDNLLLVFTPAMREGLYVDELDPPPYAAKHWIGVDLGRSTDWTVAVLMDETGGTRVLGRWQLGSPGVDADRFWGQTDERVLAMARKHNAMVVVDVGGAGGAPGEVMAERLRNEGVPVMPVRTNVQGTKAQIVEQLKADVEWRKVRVQHGRHTGQLDYELGQFQGIKRIVRGQELTIYEGPQIEGEHDDCVIAFALANWGRSRDDSPPDPLAGDYTGFFAPPPVEGDRGGASKQALDGFGFGEVPGTGWSI